MITIPYTISKTRGGLYFAHAKENETIQVYGSVSRRKYETEAVMAEALGYTYCQYLIMKRAGEIE